MARPKWTKEIENTVWTRGNGACHHCGCELQREPRRGWHIDHFPVAYRDIEDQVCCGVRDPRDVSNLVLSCPTCNTSHAHESDRCCGHTQLRCKRQWVEWCVTLALTYGTGLLTGVFLCT